MAPEHVQRIPSTDPRLARHIRHDERSRAFPFLAPGVPLESVRHTRHVPILDQGDLGSCTGNAGIGCLGTGVYYGDRGTHYALDESGAVQLYSDATRLDSFAGYYPPTDTGSDGLSIAKALKANGEIAGYLHAFTLADALAAIAAGPVIVGTAWYDGMFNPATDGEVTATGAVAGGHEYVADELDVERRRVWFSNSWGSAWGVSGRFWLSWDDFDRLLADQGDVTVFVPLTVPAPTPVPAPPAPAPVPPAPVPPAPPAPAPVVDAADLALAAKVRAWAHHPHVLSNAHAAAAVLAWLTAKGL